METKNHCVTVRHKMRVSQCLGSTAPTFWQSASQVLTLRPQALFKQLITKYSHTCEDVVPIFSFPKYKELMERLTCAAWLFPTHWNHLDAN